MISHLFQKINLEKTELLIVGIQDVVKLKLTNLFSPDNKSICDKWEQQITLYLAQNYKGFQRINRDAHQGKIELFEVETQQLTYFRHPDAHFC